MITDPPSCSLPNAALWPRPHGRVDDPQSEETDTLGTRTRPRRTDWKNLTFLTAVHVAAISGLVVLVLLQRVTLSACVIGFVGTVLTVFGISAGYHRLFSHRAFETGPVLRWVLLVLGAASFQTSAMTWASAHRRHHRHVDRIADPYNATRGFWYSHVGWVVERLEEPKERVLVPDLVRDPLIRWQHRYAIPIGACAGFALPALIGALFGDAWGGLVFGGLLRLVVTYHLTFAINSFVHKFGRQPYSERNTSRDSLIAALLTMGEGYHNYHHTFPLDYRNGAHWHSYDPTKWAVRGWEWLGLAWNLRRTPDHAIARARLKTDRARMSRLTLPDALEARISAVSRALNESLAHWTVLRRQHDVIHTGGGRPGRFSMRRSDAELRLTRRQFRRDYRRWRRLLRQL